MTSQEYLNLLKTDVSAFNKARKKNNFETINLQNAYLRNAYLRNAYLQNADLRNAYLQNADLQNAYLQNANLQYANLRNADLQNANLRNAYLQNADLQYANLRNAYLQNADLQYANLQYADLQNAYLQNANLRNSELDYIRSFTSILPEGDIFGYKKMQKGIIVKIKIPTDAKRLNHIGSRKCRAEYAIIDSVFLHPLETFLAQKIELRSQHNGMKYPTQKGEKIIPDSYDENPLVECSNGIHFFITFDEAIRY